MVEPHEYTEKTKKPHLLIRLINGFLLIAAFIQICILILGFAQIHFALPESIRNAINETLSRYHLNYHAGQQYMTANGTVCFKHLEIFLDNHKESIAECKEVELRFSILHWFLFKNPLRALIVDDTSICMPSLYTSSGKKQHCFNHINLNIRFGRKNIHVKQGNAVLENLKILLKGEIPKKILSQTQSNEPSLQQTEIDVSHYLFKIADYFESIHKALTAFEQPCIKIEIMEGPNHTLKAHTHMYGKAIHDETWGNIQQWDLSLWLDIGSTVKLTDIIQLELYNWSLPHYHFETDHAIMEFQPAEDWTIDKWNEQLLHVFKNIDARLMNANWYDCKYDYLKTNYNLFDTQIGEGQFIGYKRNDWMDVTFKYNPTDRSGSMKIDARWNPEEICALKHFYAGLEAYEEKVIFQTSPHWHADIDIGPDLTLKHAQCNFLCQNLNVLDLQLDYLEGACSITPEVIDLNPLLIIKNQEAIDVQFVTNLKNKKFHLLAKGEGYPLEFSPWFPKWWKNIFSEFELHSAPFYADLEAKGSWDDINQIFVYGLIRGEDFFYKDFHSQYASGTLWAVNWYLDLSNFHVVAFPGSEGNYGVKFVYRPASSSPYYIHLKGQGNLPQSVLTALPKTEEIREIINAPTPPWVSISASVFGDEFPEKSKNIIYIKAESSNPVSIYGYPFDNLSLEAISTTGHLSIKPLFFGFAHGTGQGAINIDWADVHNKDSQNIIALDVAINGMHRNLVQRNIPYLRNFSYLLEESTTKNNGWNAFLNHGGLIDASLKATGIKGNPLAFTGSAQAHMYDAEIGRIRLFGGLSKILDPFLFNFSSFSLNEAYAHATINHEILHFDEITLDGPSAEVMMHGNFNMATEQLDFVVEMDPYKNITTPVVSQVLKVTKPLSRALRMNLRGTKDNPSWELRHNPVSFP